MQWAVISSRTPGIWLAAAATLVLQFSCGSGDTIENVEDVPTEQNSFWISDVQPMDGGPLCTSGADCDDGNPCTEDVCRYNGTCFYDPLTLKPCEDGDPCTLADQCTSDGICEGTQTLDCDDLNPCTIDICVPGQGCTHDIEENGVACDDGDICTSGDNCLDAECVGAFPKCDDGNPCTADSCNFATGECNNLTQSNFPCDDLNACTNGDICQNGACVPGKTVDCNDDNPCTTDDCVEKPKEDGGGCRHIPAVGTQCDDLNPCTQDDKCTDSGGCAGPPASCDDGDPCTSDLCQPPDGCYYEPANGGECEDGDACTETGECQDGECQPGPVKSCDDQDPCTLDQCVEEEGCVFEPLPGCGYNCYNHYDCRLDHGHEGDVEGLCSIDQCSFAADPKGECLHKPLMCDDDKACTLDSCQPSGGCRYEPFPCVDEDCQTHADCEDGHLCTADVCDLDTGKCAFSPLLCDDMDNCTFDWCDPHDGLCLHAEAPDCQSSCAVLGDSACDDDNLCTADICEPDSGKCVHYLTTCNDLDMCTTDLCDPDAGCTFTPIPACEPCADDGACDDGNACTVDTCATAHPESLADLDYQNNGYPHPAEYCTYESVCP